MQPMLHGAKRRWHTALHPISLIHSYTASAVASWPVLCPDLLPRDKIISGPRPIGRRHCSTFRPRASSILTAVPKAQPTSAATRTWDGFFIEFWASRHRQVDTPHTTTQAASTLHLLAFAIGSPIATDRFRPAPPHHHHDWKLQQIYQHTMLMSQVRSCVGGYICLGGYTYHCTCVPTYHTTLDCMP